MCGQVAQIPWTGGRKPTNRWLKYYRQVAQMLLPVCQRMATILVRCRKD
ncbi:MAG: hypothetical protein ACI30A_00525 [Paludibacteraceae bacterium]